MWKKLKYFAKVIASFALLVTVSLGFTNPAFAKPYCGDASSGYLPDCVSRVCVTNPDPVEKIEVNEVFEIQGFVTPSECPGIYPTPNAVEVCFPYDYASNCQAKLEPINPENLVWSSLQILNDPDDREIVSTGFFGEDRVTKQNRMYIEIVE